VLIFDDDEVQRSRATALALLGLDCRTFPAATRIVADAAELRPDLVVIDAEVGGLDGRDLLRDLKRDFRTADIPVFVTGETGHPWGRSCALELGAVEFLEKPMLPCGLARRIVLHLQKIGCMAIP